MGKKFKLTCDEATTICDKSQYGEASIFEIIKLNFHFLFCKICGKYTKQNNEMTKVYKMKASDCKKEKHCLTSEEKAQIKKELQEIEA
jgi:hypothetical protein